uniref:Uncharacterized protein n=1 Tax=Lepeophtheirus salmonis TaxID=72036 RepID=A0A0K2UT55_LEPSM
MIFFCIFWHETSVKIVCS